MSWKKNRKYDLSVYDTSNDLILKNYMKFDVSKTSGPYVVRIHNGFTCRVARRMCIDRINHPHHATTPLSRIQYGRGDPWHARGGSLSREVRAYRDALQCRSHRGACLSRYHCNRHTRASAQFVGCRSGASTWSWWVFFILKKKKYTKITTFFRLFHA